MSEIIPLTLGETWRVFLDWCQFVFYTQSYYSLPLKVGIKYIFSHNKRNLTLVETRFNLHLKSFSNNSFISKSEC